MRKFFARALDGGDDGVRLCITQRGEVVVLDEHHIEHAHAMVASATAGDGVFLEPPPAGRRLARVENLCRRAFDGIHELRGQSGNTGQPLDKIQCDPFGAQNGAGRTGNFQQNFAAVDAPAVFGQSFNFDCGRKFAESGFGEIEPGDDERFTRAHDGPGRRGFGHGGECRRVAAADVLGQRGLHGASDFCSGQFHAVKMKANGKWEKEKQHT